MRALAIFALTLTVGCGSCLDEKHGPAAESSAPQPKALFRSEDGGVRVAREPKPLHLIFDGGHSDAH